MHWLAPGITISLVALLACIVSIPPLLVHFRARNFAATVLILGVTILNIQKFVNTLIWASEDRYSWWKGKILCDIEVKTTSGLPWRPTALLQASFAKPQSSSIRNI
ncbi:hypothetical protein A1O1_04449 [Capronia coronata CBS 617.96]|uniref:Uncharacterized protein n=1 Tax=Capronia coronata CBS 617.96 TaxID=1182541 RepID=W9YER1_9EURO|nr:uncharacterized protein A1O1_04449 [Capronia coronata CBS 617.96]EXJ91337.1 hypothetical protein A1O1_04449 [Capronia coronata CBS 617.96]